MRGWSLYHILLLCLVWATRLGFALPVDFNYDGGIIRYSREYLLSLQHQDYSPFNYGGLIGLIETNQSIRRPEKTTEETLICITET